MTYRCGACRMEAADAFDRCEQCGVPDQCYVVEHRMTDFGEWIAKIESEIASDVDPELFREYFDAGMSPNDAIDAARDEEEMP